MEVDIMPIYEFNCAGCGENFEELVFGQSSTIICPKCKGSEVKKLMSAFAFKSGSNFVSSSSGSGCGSCSSHSCSTCGSS
jgi:putative FmdB family regulatory protein